MSKSVFISYRTTDSVLADRLYILLSSQGVTCWRDSISIEKGVLWPDAVDNGLQNCDLILACVTPLSLLSRNVRNEWHWAREYNKPLVFVYWETIEWMDPAFAATPMIDFRGAYTIQRVENRIVEPVIDLTAEVEAETQLLNIIQLDGALSTKADLSFYVQAMRFTDPAPEWIVPSQEIPEDTADLQNLRRFVWDEFIDRDVMLFSHGKSFIKQNYVVTPPIETLTSLPIHQAITSIVLASDVPIVLVGALGSGKTTLLLALMRDLLELSKDDPFRPVPILIPISFVFTAERKENIEFEFVKCIADQYALSIDDVVKWLLQGRLTIFIEGIEQFQFDTLSQLITDYCFHLMEQFPQIKFVLGTDKPSMPSNQRKFCLIELNESTDLQVEDYIRDMGSPLEGLRAAHSMSEGLRRISKDFNLLRVLVQLYSNLQFNKINLPPTQGDPTEWLLDTYTQQVIHSHFPDQSVSIIRCWLGALIELSSIGPVIDGRFYSMGRINGKKIGVPAIEKLLPKWQQFSAFTVSLAASGFSAVLVSVIYILFYNILQGGKIGASDIIVVSLGSICIGFVGVLIRSQIQKLLFATFNRATNTVMPKQSRDFNSMLVEEIVDDAIKEESIKGASEFVTDMLRRIYTAEEQQKAFKEGVQKLQFSSSAYQLIPSMIFWTILGAMLIYTSFANTLLNVSILRGATAGMALMLVIFFAPRVTALLPSKGKRAAQSQNKTSPSTFWGRMSKRINEFENQAQPKKKTSFAESAKALLVGSLVFAVIGSIFGAALSTLVAMPIFVISGLIAGYVLRRTSKEASDSGFSLLRNGQLSDSSKMVVLISVFLNTSGYLFIGFVGSVPLVFNKRLAEYIQKQYIKTRASYLQQQKLLPKDNKRFLEKACEAGLLKRVGEDEYVIANPHLARYLKSQLERMTK